MQRLTELLQSVSDDIHCDSNVENVSIHSITADSRQVRKGSLFAALKGAKQNGEVFIADAKLSGAAAVLCDEAAIVKVDIPVLRAANSRRALALLAAAFYGRQPSHMVAITGTDGKTSTADFYRQFCTSLGKKSASIGTLGVLQGDGTPLHEGSHTTPDPVGLHKILCEMTDLDIDYASLEASSHGLDQNRLDGVKVQAAAFTNIARDHLDYHGTEESYFQAKSRLFSDVLIEGGTAVLNQDDKRFPALKKLCEQRNITVLGFGHSGAELRIESLVPHAAGQRAKLTIMDKTYTIDIPLVGNFQVMNILAALGLVHGCGLNIAKAAAHIGKLKGVPGRMELVTTLDNGAAIYVDYAHTPMALANVLSTIRPHTTNMLHVVFGCGGDRDKGKRPEMAKEAGKLADHVIVTDDNPRTEDPAMIRAQVMAGCPDATEIGDRKEAIYAAVKKLSSGDVLVIAGKGHEKTQTIGTKTIAFDDVAIAKQAAHALKLSA